MRRLKLDLDSLLPVVLIINAVDCLLDFAQNKIAVTVVGLFLRQKLLRSNQRIRRIHEVFL